MKKIILSSLFFTITFCSVFERKSIYNTRLDFKPSTQGEVSALLTIELGVAALSEKNTVDSKRHFEKAISIDRKNPYSYFFLGIIALQEESPQKSLGYFQRAHSLLQNKNFWLAQTYKYLGISHHKLKHPEEAKKFFLKSQALDSKDEELEEYLK